jgi:hypothetical protein
VNWSGTGAIILGCAVGSGITAYQEDIVGDAMTWGRVIQVMAIVGAALLVGGCTGERKQKGGNDGSGT